MHTQEERTKAVYLFIECGFNHAAVKAELGYPARTTLDRWYADYLDKGYVKERREHWEKFTDEEKARAVDACVAKGFATPTTNLRRPSARDRPAYLLRLSFPDSS